MVVGCSTRRTIITNMTTFVKRIPGIFLYKAIQKLYQKATDLLNKSINSILVIFLSKVKGPILVEQLFQIVSCNLPESLWSNLFNTPIHLTSFLRLFSDSFHIQSNLVTLLQPPKIMQKHIISHVSQMVENKKSNEELKNAKNLTHDTASDIIEKNEKASPPPWEKERQSSERQQPSGAQLSPRSISDRLKQPKLQQSLSDAQSKSLSPEPPATVSQPQSASTPSDPRKRANFKLGGFFSI